MYKGYLFFMHLKVYPYLAPLVLMVSVKISSTFEPAANDVFFHMTIEKPLSIKSKSPAQTSYKSQVHGLPG